MRQSVPLALQTPNILLGVFLLNDKTQIVCCSLTLSADREFEALANLRFINELITRAVDVVRRRGYGDHFVTICVYVGMRVGVYVTTIKRKPLIGMT